MTGQLHLFPEDCPPLRYQSRADGTLPPMSVKCHECGAKVECPKHASYFGNWLHEKGWRWRDRDEHGIYFEGIRFCCPECQR